MNYLLDTHAFLWAAMTPGKLSREVKTALGEPANDIHVSAVSFWELSLKFALGKIELSGVTPGELPRAARDMGFSILELAPEDAATFHELPRLEHKGPFDRILVWQAIRQELTLVSKDSALREYESRGLTILW